MINNGKRKIITAVITGALAVAAFVCGAALTACNKGGVLTNAPETPIKVQLETPTNLQINDEYLTWDEVENAVSYVVEINGVEYSTQTNGLDIFEIAKDAITYNFTVCAVGNDETSCNSKRSEKISYSVNPSAYLEFNKLSSGGYEVCAQNTEQAKRQIKGKLSIPSTYNGRPVTAIAALGFSQCENITGVYVPDNVKTIGENAFKDCTSLKRISLSKNLNKISNGAFYGCSALGSVTLNEGLSALGDLAFGYCESLESLALPASLQDLSPSAIAGCDNLIDLTVAEGNPVYKSDGNFIIRKSDNTLITGNGGVIPDYVTAIGESAFYGCRTIKELVIPGSVKQISNFAFQYFEGLKSLTISEGVTSVGANALYCCDGLESLSLPSTLQSLPQLGITGNCKNLKELTVAEGNPVYKSDGNCIIRKQDNLLVEGCVGSVIPDYIKVIGQRAFAFTQGLESILIPDGVTEIGELAFAYCSNVKSIFIPTSVIKIGSRAFDECDFASVTIPDSVEIIKDSAFATCLYYCTYGLGNMPPEGWDGNVSGSTGFVVFYCEFIYDGSYPYVHSVSCFAATMAIGNEYYIFSPYRLGYTFLGWATDEGSDEIAFGVEQTNVKLMGHTIEKLTVSRVSKDVMLNVDRLYAVWQKNN